MAGGEFLALLFLANKGECVASFSKSSTNPVLVCTCLVKSRVHVLFTSVEGIGEKIVIPCYGVTKLVYPNMLKFQAFVLFLGKAVRYT